MRMYWYWPWPAERVHGLAAGAVDPADELVVQTLAGDTAPASTAGPARRLHSIVADLPAPVPHTEWSPRWAADRSSLLVRRVLRRRRLVADRGPFDVAHLQLLHFMVDAWALPRLARQVPLVSTVHDVVPHHHRMPQSLELSLLRRTYAGAGRIVVYHDHLRRRLEQDFDVDPARLVTIPHPVRAFRGAAAPAATSRPFTVLFFGAFRRNKGIGVLLQAIERLRDLPDVRFHFAGRGIPALEQEVTSAAAGDARITADVRFVPTDERDRAYAGADLVVLPYTSFASQSGIVADAYSHGVPLLVTEVGALGDTIREDRTGWVVPPGDAQRLAEAIVAIAADDAGRADAGRVMRALAEDRSEHNTGRAFRRLYQEVAGGR